MRQKRLSDETNNQFKFNGPLRIQLVQGRRLQFILR